jgi:hypothetical protein
MSEEYNEGGVIHPPESTIDVERIVAEWRRYGVAQVVSHELAATADFSVHQDMIFGGLMLRLEREILTDRRAKDEYQASLHVPRSPWHHWKHKHRQAWWLRWLVRRRPVQTHEHIATVQVERWQTYPDARLPRETFGRAVIYENVTGPLWKEHP